MLVEELRLTSWPRDGLQIRSGELKECIDSRMFCSLASGVWGGGPGLFLATKPWEYLNCKMCLKSFMRAS